MSKFYKLFVVILVITVALLVCACDKNASSEEFNLENLEIIASDEINIAAGIYKVPYTIQDLQTYIERFGIIVQINAVDADDTPVQVTGDSFEVEEGKTYTVTIKIISDSEEIKTKVITISGIQPLLNSITITTLPTKTSYFEGEIFDPEGMLVSANYSNGTVQTTDYTYSLDQLELSDNIIVITHTPSGKQAILSITVNALIREIQSIEILTMPAKIVYIEGETFDPWGMGIIAHYNDGSSEILAEDSYTYRTQILTLLDTRLAITHTASGKFTIIDIQIIPYDSIFTVTFNGGGGTLASGEEIQNVRITFDAVAPVYIKKGFLFNGWDKSYKNISSNITVTALWLNTSVGSSSLSYELNSNYSAYYVNGYWGNEETVIIPPSYNNLPVESIGSEAFLNNTTTHRIYIGSAIESIGYNAFKGCSALHEFIVDSYNINYYTYQNALYYGDCLLSVPKATKGAFNLIDGTTSIAMFAFEDCIDITNLNIPDSVLNVGQYAFRNSGWYNGFNDGVIYANHILLNYKGTMPADFSLVINPGTYAIASGAFSNQENLVSVAFNEELLVIGNSAFYDCSGITEINFPDNLDTVGINAFTWCENLVLLNINKKLSKLGDIAFQNCRALVTVDFNNNDMLQSIGENAFQNCTLLKNLNFGEDSNIKVIEEYAFQNCYVLEALTLPSYINNIMSNAFENCKALTDLALPESIKTIGNYAFAGCTSLKIINTSRTTAPAIGEDVFFGADGAFTIWVLRIAFFNYKESWTDYQNIIYPYTVLISFDSMGGNDVDSIETDYLTAITEPEFPLHPEKYFNAWYLDANYAYLYNFSTLLTSDIILYAKWNDYTPSLVFEKYNEDMTCAVIGIGNDETSVFVPSIFQGYTVTKISSNVFKDKEMLTTVRLPLTLKEIGISTFSGCSNLSLINLPSSLESIGMNAFENCQSLDLQFPDSISYIGSNALINTLWLENQADGIIYAGRMVYGYKGQMPENYNITSFRPEAKGFAQGAFSNQSNLVYVAIPSNFTNIEASAFANSGLTSVIIPKAVTKINNSAFYNCYSLTEITFEENSELQTIEMQAFYNNAITSLVLPAGIESISNNAFGSCTQLKSVTVLAIEPPLLQTNVFCYYLMKFFPDLIILVPAQSIENYKNAENWTMYADNIVAIE